jgi:5-methylthioadenosine/S-adenosylhomocysteine deaminase
MSDILIRSAAHVLNPARTDVDVLIKGGRVAKIGQGLAAPQGAKTISGKNRLVAPGLINGHWHSAMQSSPGTADRLDHKRFMWLNQADTANRTADEVKLAMLLGAIQMIRSGTTAVMDHFPEQRFEIGDVQAAVEALAQSGMRAVVALRIFDGEYHDIMPEEGQRTPELVEAIRANNTLVPRPMAESLAITEEAMRRFDKAESRIRVFPAPSNPSRCSDAFLVACQKLAEKYDAGVHCHLLETETQKTGALRRYGKTMIAHLAALGAFDRRWSCAHCNWVTPEDMEIMAQRRAVAVFNPESNLKIGSGVPPIPALLRAGVPCALGTDGASTNDNLVLQDAMQLAAIIHRVYEPDRARWVTVEDVLTMGTTGGAAALLEPELGRVEVGQKADLVLYDLDESWWVPLNEVVQQFVFGERGGSVRTVIVDGKIVMEDGRLATIDEAAVIQEAKGLLRTSRKRNARIQSIADAFVKTA